MTIDKLLSCYERVSFLLNLKEKHIIKKKNIDPWINVWYRTINRLGISLNETNN